MSTVATKKTLEDFLNTDAIDKASRDATELLAPVVNGKPTFITVDRNGNILHRPPKKLKGNKAYKNTVRLIAGK